MREEYYLSEYETKKKTHAEGVNPLAVSDVGLLPVLSADAERTNGSIFRRGKRKGRIIR